MLEKNRLLSLTLSIMPKHKGWDAIDWIVVHLACLGRRREINHKIARDHRPMFCDASRRFRATDGRTARCDFWLRAT
jgi:hypothetical protein